MITVRPLADADAEASRQLRHEAFGSRIPDSPAQIPRRGQHWLGAYDGDRLVGRIADREHESWFGGALVPTSGMAGVTIAMEDRGSGVLDPLIAANLRDARDRGAVVSTMFPTAVGIYRRHGYERICELQTIRLSMQTLATVRRPDGVTLRRATVDDVPAVWRLHEEWASRHDGPLSRRGPHFSSRPERWLSRFTGVTVAEDEQGICAYAAWDRSSGHTQDAYLVAHDLLWSRPSGAQALLAMFATNAPVAGSLKIETSTHDPLRLVVGANHWHEETADVYGLKVLDVVKAFELRTWDAALRCTLPFRLVDDFLPELDGGYVLDVADGRAHVTRADVDDATTFTSRGLAAAYAGAHPIPTLRTLGLVGGDASRDTTWATVLGGRRPAVHDYF